MGMSPEFLERMYEPFEQARDERAGIQEGTGLGLSITQNLVRLMNGRLEVESELGKGTRFTVLLPLKPAEPEPAEARTAPAEPGWQAFLGKRVLVVEDNELNMEIAKTILEMKGFVVDMAANDREGVDQFAASEPGLYFAILMDIRMPVMDGLAAARAIRALDRPDAASVPIVAMSANAFHEEIAGAKRAGINDYLTKPIDTIELFAKLDRFVHEMRK